MKRFLTACLPFAALPLLTAAEHPEADIVTLWRADCTPCWHEATMLPQFAKEHPDVHFTLLVMHGDVPHKDWPENIDITREETDAPFVKYGDMSKHLPFSVALHRDGSVCAGQDGLLSETAINMWKLQCAR